MPELNRRSFFGSLRDNLSKKSAITSEDSTTKSTTPQLSRNTNMNNPFSSRSPATRRPRASSPPPSYNDSISPTGKGATTTSTSEDPYAFLSDFDTAFLIDDSGSMAGRSWTETRTALRSIAPVCAAHDPDGVDVYFLNARNRIPSRASTMSTNAGVGAGGFHNIRSASAVEDLFSCVRPGGGTPTGTRIQAILGPYVAAYERSAALTSANPDGACESPVRPINLIVITDGVPTDDPESVLLALARRLDRAGAPPYQVGVQFFQVGDEPGAREALVELDDELGRHVVGEAPVRDMVDATTWDAESEGGSGVLTGEGILKAVLGAVVKRLDRRSVAGMRSVRMIG